MNYLLNCSFRYASLDVRIVTIRLSCQLQALLQHVSELLFSKLRIASGEVLLLQFLYFVSPGCDLDHRFVNYLPREYVGKPNDMFQFINSFSCSPFRCIFICFHKYVVQTEPEVPSVPVFWQFYCYTKHNTNYGANAVKSSLPKKTGICVVHLYYARTARPTLTHHIQTKLGHISKLFLKFS